MPSNASSIRRSQRSLLALLVSAGLTISCGGGGENAVVAGGGTSPDSSSVQTYGSTTLPGRLLVNAPDGRHAELADLRSGERASLPDSSSGAEHDRWRGSPDGTMLLRWNTADWLTTLPLEFFSTPGVTRAARSVGIPSALGSGSLQVSPDGRYLLSYFGDNYGVERRMTVFDAATGQIVKRGSQLDGESVISQPMAWLPDGRYVYMVGEKLYASSPERTDSDLLATLVLPSNSSFPNGGYVAGQSELSASPDGTRLAFTWYERREGLDHVFDNHVYVVRTDGTDLRRLTRVADASSALSHGFGSPTWSPDGVWVAFVLYMNATTTALVWPDEPFAGARVVGTTGCDSSPVYVLRADASNTAIPWPAVDAAHALKVRATSGSGGEWVTTCSSIQWLP